MVLRAEEARAEIAKNVVVTRQRVTLAKYFLRNLPEVGPYEPLILMDQFAKEQGYRLPEKIVLHPNVDPDPQIRQAAGYFICLQAFAEAIWALVHEGLFLPMGAPQRWEGHQKWTTIVPGGSGTSSGWSFSEYSFELPRFVILAPSYRQRDPERLTDPDLFILELGIENADREVIEALQDAVRCFRQELYRPAVTMLGKAMEGAWIELGRSLANAAPVAGPFNKDKFLNTMTDENVGIASKIQRVIGLYNQKEVIGGVITESGISPRELDSVVVWADVLRESRNAIHFGAKPVIANNYEKVAVLFLEGARSLAALYKIKRTADGLST